MPKAKIKKAFLKQIKVDDVMEELKANNYFECAHRDMLAYFKNSLEYKQMKDVAVQHMLDALTNSPQLPDEEARKEKKKQIAEIGFLALQINTSVIKTISEKLKEEAAVTAKRTLKRMADKKSRLSVAMKNSWMQRRQNTPSYIKSMKQKKRQTTDSDSVVSLESMSSNSVSSVHTSDLSSFDDEIIVSSEDEKGERKVKRISFKTANKAYFDDGFSKIQKVNARERDTQDEVPKESKPKKRSLSNKSTKKSMKSIKSPIDTARPKRERRPNSKYSAEDMYL